MKEKKTIEVISKNGTKYHINPEKYQARLEKEREARIARGLSVKGPNVFTRSTPYCDDKNNESYMRYWEKKLQIRSEYPGWKEISRKECREYYSKVLELIYTDEDYKEYKYQTRTMEEKEDDKWWEDKKEKEKRYNGTNDEYYY